MPDIAEADSRSRDDDRATIVVGLGASAGGVGALREFFMHVDANSGAAYVVILHLSPDHDSRLAEVLQATSTMPVAQVTEPTPIEANHVYVISPNRTLEIENGVLVPAETTRPEQRRAPVDIFFRTLADSHGTRSVCVVLSGTGPNGSAGLKRVKEYGGLAIVQDPEEAEYADMPRNSIATGLVDYVLPVAEMPGAIANYQERLRWMAAEASATTAADQDPMSLRDILTLLRVRTGHDFSNYKAATVLRRIERRLTVLELPNMATYAKTLREQPGEGVALMKELLISVTNFFRDPDAFKVLEQRVIPKLLELRHGYAEQVRIWVPGCATGEEAYSIAMLFAEATKDAAEPPTVQIFATDLDEQAIAIAREGLYTTAEIADLSEERVARFFQRESSGFRVKRELREMILFAHHNVIKDPPFSHLDLISCRNLLIYLNRAIQERVIETFHFALRPGGYLFLGTSEGPEGGSDLFLTVDKSAHIFESRTVATRVSLPLADPQPRLPRLPRLPLTPQEPRLAERISPGELHQRLLEQYAPPSLVITDEHNIVHLSEGASRFLQIAGGEPSRDLFRLLRPEMRAEVRAALHQAARDRTMVEVRGITVILPAGDARLNVIVKPILRDGDPARGFFLLVFEEAAGQLSEEPVRVPALADATSRQLEDELSRLKSQLHATIGQYETQAEEAKASNEELQAMNEELRSAAEELETSKEELQSVNEELTTVNQELKIKIEELAATNNDFQNLINSTDIGTIFLDRQLRVKMSTPRAADVFNIVRSDIGRPLSNFTSKLRYEHLQDDLQMVLDRLQTIDHEVQTVNGLWYLMRIAPYRTADNRIDGVVLTFQDVTARRFAEQKQLGSEERLRLLIESTIDYAIFTLTRDGIVESWNPGAERMFGYTAAEIVGQDGALLFTPEDRQAGVPSEELRRAVAEGRAEDERWHVRKGGMRLYCSGVTTRLGDGELAGFAKIARDLTPQREAADSVALARADLENRVRERTTELRGEIEHRAAAQQHVLMLLRKVVTTQEEERARIARDLHDHLGQQLTALRLALDRIGANCPPGARDNLDRAMALTQKLDGEIDFLAWELRPATLDDLGLASALPRFLAEWAEHYNIAAEFRLGRFASGQLSPEGEVAFYRIAQEALNNVVKHAHASRVDVLLDAHDGSVVLVVEDDGVGFDPDDALQSDRGLGLLGMRERAALVGASLDIESTPGEGTSVFVRCPTLRPTAAGGRS